MQDIDRAYRIRNLGNDDSFKEVLDEVKREETKVFLNPRSSADEREDAHAIIRALDKVEAKIRAANNTLTVAEKIGPQDRGDND